MMAQTSEQRGEGGKRRLLRGILLGALILLLAFSMTPPGRQLWKALFRVSGFDSGVDAPLSIHVLDVGKADAILIQCENHAALVDAGTYLSGDVVVDYMARCGFPKLDYVIASHPDKDHIGGMAQVLSETGAGEFVRSSYFSEEYAEIDSVLEERDIPCRTVSAGDTLELGGASLSILGPVKEYDDTNNTSLVFRLEYKGFTALFCGDMEKEGEKDLVKSGAQLSADLLKVAHHGSQTSSSKRFLAAVDPDYAVISVGPDRNDLPDEKALLRLEETRTQIYRTDTDGTVIFAYDGETITVLTEK